MCHQNCQNDMYASCEHCTLDFHVKCIDDVDIFDVEQNNIWYCRNCFHKICDDELPFSDGFIDF